MKPANPFPALLHAFFYERLVEQRTDTEQQHQSRDHDELGDGTHLVAAASDASHQQAQVPQGSTT